MNIKNIIRSYVKMMVKIFKDLNVLNEKTLHIKVKLRGLCY